MVTVAYNDCAPQDWPHGSPVLDSEGPGYYGEKESRESLNRFSVTELQKIHLDLFQKTTGDNIKRRLALKIWRGLEAKYRG